MTPKEQALELVAKYSRVLPINQTTLLDHKNCALIAVDEIINTLNHDIRDLDVRGSILLDLIKYWRDVQQEIEKL